MLHAVKVVNAITAAIGIVDDKPMFKKVLNDLGVMHEKKGIAKAAFPVVGMALNASLEAALGKNCTIDVLNIVNAFYNEVTLHMTEV
mmetsp:Transcript_57894/g.48922  ORF Transcript_57894/g.48922 Transcript_57894/m.48922 type:complete len:87 (-) Transcript_57894:295-555(-)